MTPYQLHVQNWKDCQRCQCSNNRTQVVNARGSVPCDILFVGEAPGESENDIGKPFIGPAGKLLDQIIDDAYHNKYICTICEKGNHLFNLSEEVTEGYATCVNGHSGFDNRRKLKFAFNNIIGCIPLDDEEKKVSEPEHNWVMACKPRLEEFVSLIKPKPKLIVCVGKVAEHYLDPSYKHSIKIDKTIERITIVHPSAILKGNPVQKPLTVKRQVVTLIHAINRIGSLPSLEE